jgi:hypothetical protein
MGWAKTFFEKLRAMPEIERAAELKRELDSRRGEEEWLELDCKKWWDEEAAKQNLAKEASAFANAQGGIIVWGFERKGNEPAIEEPINGLKGVVDRLNVLGPECAEPPVPDIRTIAAATADDSGFAVTYVSESNVGPHRTRMGADSVKGRYFRRHSDRAREMTHRELDEMFGRRPRPFVVPEIVLIPREVRNPDNFKMVIDLWNIGLGISKWTALWVRIFSDREWWKANSPIPKGGYLRPGKHPGAGRPYYSYDILPADERWGIVYPHSHEAYFKIAGSCNDATDLAFQCRIGAENMRPWKMDFTVPAQLFKNEPTNERVVVASWRARHLDWGDVLERIPVPEGYELPLG